MLARMIYPESRWMMRSLSCLCGKSVRKVYFTEKVKIQHAVTTHGRAHQRCMSDQKGGRFTQDRDKQRQEDLYPMTTVSNSNANKYSKDGETAPAVSEELHHLKEVYSTALGGYQQWSNQVDLGPPKSRDRNIRVPQEDKWIWDYYNSLQYTLYETGYPETQDRTAMPRNQYTASDISVVLLSSPVECMAMLLEGGRQSPDNFLLVLSSTWVSKGPSESYPDLYSLYVHKAITFSRGGMSYIEEYNPPRKTTYLVNYFTGPITSGQRNDGEEIEKDLDCPMSSSLKLANMVDDKVLTRCLMSEVGMEIPKTLAFMFKSERLLKAISDKIKIVHLDKNCGIENQIKEEVNEFAEKLSVEADNKIVVKPSGPEFHGSIGVSYHGLKDVTSITAAVMVLLKQLKPSNSVLVETFVDTLTPSQQGVISQTDNVKPWMANGNLAFRVRSTVCRGPTNKAVATQIICGISSKSKPVNGDNTVCQSLDTTLLAYGVTDVSVRQRVAETIKTQSQALLEALIKYEDTLALSERGALFGQTDLVGLDFIVTQRNDEIIPTCIEVNSHDCTINCQIFEFVNAYMGYDQGECVRPLIQTMIQRSQQHVMKGKTILVIGGGAYSKKNIWPDSTMYGIKVILVDADEHHFAKDEVHEFIHYNYNDHTNDPFHARSIVAQVTNLDLHVDGCLTFWEDCGPLTANICKLLGLTGNDCNSALIAKKKSWTHEALRGKSDDIPHWPRTYLYTANTQTIREVDDIQQISENFSFPVVLKLEYGSSAVAVYLVKSVTDLKEKYSHVQNTLQNEGDFGGIGLGFGNNMAVMEYLDGTEHDVDIVIYQRKMVGAFVSDNGPTRVPLFTETAATMPSTLPSDKISQLITAAYQCCTEIGLANGVFNVELKMTPTGPKLIEINARMGGFYNRDWIKRIYSVDIMFCAMQIASGVKPFIPKVEPNCQIMGVMLVPSLHGHLLDTKSRSNNIVKGMILKDDIVWNQFERELSDHTCGTHEEPIANIAVSAKDFDTAREKLLTLCGSIGISSEDYKVDYFINHF